MTRIQKQQKPLTKNEIIQHESRQVWKDVAVNVANALGVRESAIVVAWADKISDMYIARYLGNRQSGKDINGNKL